MGKLYFGWDYYNYSQVPKIKKIILKRFSDPEVCFRPNLIYPNDGDTLPLFNESVSVTNPYHNLVDILADYEDDKSNIVLEDTTKLIEKDIPFIYLIGIMSGPQEWGIDKRNTLFHNIKSHTKKYIRDGKVLIVIDMSSEGYPVENIDELTLTETGNIPNIPLAIEKAAKRENFPLKNMCYLTGNTNAVNFKQSKINIITLDWPAIAMKKRNRIASDYFERAFEYKKKNVDNSSMKHFLCLCKLVKDGRLYHSLGLNYYKLHEKGLTSLIIPQKELIVLNERLWPGAAAKPFDIREEVSTRLKEVDDFEFNKNITEFEEYIRVVKLKLRLIGELDIGMLIKSDDNIKNLLKKLPLYVDLKSFKDEDGNPISGYNAWNESLYNDTFFSYLYESYAYNTKTIYVTEKFWKCVLNFHPTMLVTNPYTIRYLKERGYKTFSPFIDESYDEIEDFDLRSTRLLEEINKLCQMTKTQLLNWYERQSDTLIHNYTKYIEEDIVTKPINKIKNLYGLL